MDPTPETLADIPLFASLSPEERRAVVSLSEMRSAAAGHVLVGEGASGHALFIILEGTAEVSVGDLPVSTLRRGDFFGEIALLGEGRRTATVTARSPVELVVMHGSDFRVFERDWPEASELLKSAVRERLVPTTPRTDDAEG